MDRFCRGMWLGAAVALFAVAFVATGAEANHQNYGTGPGCSAIEGVDVTTLAGGACVAAVCVGGPHNGDACGANTDCGSSFTGRIGVPGVTGLNKNGRPAQNSDSDAFTDSLESCINDALVGYCTTILGDDTGKIQLIPGPTVGNNQQEFTVVFLDTSGCAVTQCSDHLDNEGTPDGLVDFPADPECTDYNDNTEDS